MTETNFSLTDNIFEDVINTALKEDFGNGDLTTDLIIPSSLNAKAFLQSKAEGIIAGLKVAESVFKKLDPEIKWRQLVNDGDKIKRGDVLVKFEGTYKAILTGERTGLNFLQRMSAIATAASKFVEAVSGTKVKILDSRKTAPGLRMIDKYAVKIGGGTNHRIGLYDMVLIKDNHIKIAGGITSAVNQVRAKLKSGIKIEVETSTIEEVEEAIKLKVDLIMLDNMSTEMMKHAVELINGSALIEASGNMSLDRVKEVADTGVDFISVGALTHSVTALDIAQYIETN